MKPVKVVWHDAHAEGESWVCADDIDADPYVVTSVGWLLADVKPGHVVIAQSQGFDGVWDHVLSIPVGMVQRLVELRE